MASYTTTFPSWSGLENLLSATQRYYVQNAPMIEAMGTSIAAQASGMVVDYQTSSQVTGHAGDMAVNVYGSNLGTSYAIITRIELTAGEMTAVISGAISSTSGAFTSGDASWRGYVEHSEGRFPIDGSASITTSVSKTIPTDLGIVNTIVKGTVTEYSPTYASYNYSSFSVSDNFGHSFTLSGMNYGYTGNPETDYLTKSPVDLVHNALSGNDSASGSSKSDELQGFAGNDYLSGLAGDDTLTGGLGSDTIDGGSGKDIAIFSGMRSSYTITRGTSYITVKDNAGSEGTESLINIERLQFADAKVALDTSGNPNAGFDLKGLANTGQVYRLYQAAFDRQPDMSGLANWIAQADTGMPLVTIASNFVNSWEFGVKYGSPSDHAFVDLLYQHVLHRPGEPGGLAYWYGEIDSHRLTREQILVGFSDSAENQAALIGVIQNGIDYTT